MKAVILAGGENARLALLTRSCPKSMLPFLNRPLVESQLIHLGRQGFSQVGLALSPSSADRVATALGDGKRLGVSLHYLVDDIPRGPAGCLKRFGRFVGDDPFVVINGNIYLGSIDLGRLVKSHDAQEAVATLAMYPDVFKPSHVENISLSSDGRIQAFHVMHPSRDRRRPRRFGGIYLFQPRVMEFIRTDGYMDIKEQLIPALSEAGCGISEHLLDGFYAYVDTLEGYYHAHQAALRHHAFEHDDYLRVGDGVWAHREARIAPSAFVLGPALIGPGTVVEDQAYVIGPVAIGAGCVVQKGGVVRESLVWNETRIGRDARLEYCIAGHRLTIAPGVSHREAVLMGETATPLDESQSRGGRGVTPAPVPPRCPALRHRLYEAGKRMLDIVGSAVGLVLCLPMFAVIAVLTKGDSPGPVFFHQRRCGKDGREFWMVKFRTMVAGAERLQRGLSSRNDVDGPVFKIFDDPRVTRVGRLLRKASLDELPQLVNVLKGEMSLVGPRPLAASEMRYSPTWTDFRLRVKPGLTGLWQLRGRSRPGFHEWIRCDIEYVKRQSFLLDMEILLKTAWVVFKGI